MAIAEYTAGLGTWYWGWGGAGGGDSGGLWYGQGEWDGFAYGFFAPNGGNSGYYTFMDYTIFSDYSLFSDNFGFYSNGSVISGSYSGDYGGVTTRGSYTGYATIDGRPAFADSSTDQWLTNIGGKTYAWNNDTQSWLQLTMYDPSTKIDGCAYQWDPVTQTWAEVITVTADKLGNDVAENPSWVNATAASGGFTQLAADMQTIMTDNTLYGMSQQGIDFLKQLEGGYVDHVYTDSTGNQTFGWGHKITPADQSIIAQLPNMTDAQKLTLAETFFTQDLQNAQQVVFEKLGSTAIGTLSQNQYDALVADSFNAGYNGALGPHMIMDINNGNFVAAGNEFNAYYGVVNGVYQYIPGLATRNAEERDLFVNGNYHPN